MKVISFPEVPKGEGRIWRPVELNRMVASVAPSLRSGEVGGWACGTTEAGDPQLYVLGPSPDCDCILSVSRLGPLYLLEDGAGRIVLEHNSLAVVAEQIKSFLRAGKAGLVARVALLWCGLRQVVTEKIEPLLVESEEMITSLGPQLAALA